MATGALAGPGGGTSARRKQYMYVVICNDCFDGRLIAIYDDQDEAERHARTKGALYAVHTWYVRDKFQDCGLTDE